MKSRFAFMLSAAAVAGGLFCTAASAQVLLSDNFNSENGGVGTLNYTGFANWTVTRGSVDLIGNGFFDFYPGNGLYIDTEGSTGVGGTITSNQTFNFQAGNTYTLSFDLAGDARGGTNSEIVTLGSIWTNTYTLPSAQGYTLESFTFTPSSDESATLSFAAGEDGDVGLILDNVSLTEQQASTGPSAVPEPSTYGLIGAAMLLLGAFARRNKRV